MENVNLAFQLSDKTIKSSYIFTNNFGVDLAPKKAYCEWARPAPLRPLYPKPSGRVALALWHWHGKLCSSRSHSGSGTS